MSAQPTTGSSRSTAPATTTTTNRSSSPACPSAPAKTPSTPPAASTSTTPPPGPDPRRTYGRDHLASAITPRPFLAYSGRPAVWMFTFAQGGNANQKPRFPPPLQEPGTGARSCPRGPGFLMAPGHRASSVACWSPRVARATRSLPAARRGRDGLVRRLVDAKDLRQPGDLQDLQDPLLRADQVQRAVAGPHPLQAPDQHPEAGGVEEPDPAQVDDELVAALADQVDEQLPQPRRGIHIDLALHVDDLDAVL